MISTNFKSILDLIKAFPDEQSCIDHLEKLRWNGDVVSPFDPTSKVYNCKGNKYRCKNTGKYFNVKTNTIFDNTKLGLQKWFLAIYIVTSHKKGISSLQLGRDLDITQKSAWFMLQRIRKCFGIENNNELDGMVECDETFIGGKNKNRHGDKKVKNSQGRSFKDKTPVAGMLQRGESEIIQRPHKVIPNKIVKEKIIHTISRINAFVVPNTKRNSIQPLVCKYVNPEITTLVSDEWLGYTGLDKYYDHRIIDHSKKEYVSLQDNNIHTNNIEGSWNILKKSVSGMYNHVSRKHLQKYVDEFVYRFNTRKHTTENRFNLLLLNLQTKLTYKTLING